MTQITKSVEVALQVLYEDYYKRLCQKYHTDENCWEKYIVSNYPGYNTNDLNKLNNEQGNFGNFDIQSFLWGLVGGYTKDKKPKKKPSYWHWFCSKDRNSRSEEWCMSNFYTFKTPNKDLKSALVR